jgi:low temperature requirement protein LtrA
MIGAAALAVNVTDGLGNDSAGFALSYAAIRVILVVEYMRTGRSKQYSSATPLIRRYTRGFLCAAVVWIISAFIPPPFRFVLWGIGLVIDFATPITARRLPQFAPHISHLPERMGLFTIIVLGESIMGVVAGVSDMEFDIYSMIMLGLGLSIPLAYGGSTLIVLMEHLFVLYEKKARLACTPFGYSDTFHLLLQSHRSESE